MGGRRKELFGETYRGDCRIKSFWVNQGFRERQLSPLRHRMVDRMWISGPLVTLKQKGAEDFACLFLSPNLVSLVYVLNSVQGADSCLDLPLTIK